MMAMTMQSRSKVAIGHNVDDIDDDQDLHIAPLSFEKLRHDKLLPARTLSLLLVQFLLQNTSWLYQIFKKYIWKSFRSFSSYFKVIC